MMNSNRWLIVLLLISVSGLDALSLLNNKEHSVSYILCIDGGGSKTSLQIVNTSAPNKPIFFEKNGITVSECKVKSSNINVIGLSQLKLLLEDLFESIVIDSEPLASIIHKVGVIGGFAGLSKQTVIDSVTNLIEQWGFKYVEITNDITIASKFIEHDGIVLIAGTGSICFAKLGKKTLRVGGFGGYLGDEGSGYYIGKLAIIASLEYEYGYGQDTMLRQDICRSFDLQNIRDIVPLFYTGRITQQQVAALALLVFERADVDLVARSIIESAADELAKLVQKAVFTLTMKPSNLYLFGGVFKNNQKDRFIQRIIQKADLQEWNINNMSFRHPVIALLQQKETN